MLKIGNYKNTDNPDGIGLDLTAKSTTPDTGSETGESVSETVDTTSAAEQTTETTDTPSVDTSSSASTETASESAETSETIKTTSAEGQTTATETESVSNEDKNNTSNSELGNTNTFEVTEELALKYLSEKLGKDVNSLDDLKVGSKNPLDDDPYLKGLAEWREKTGRPIEDWIKFQKDYSKMDDLNVARELLQHEYPELTDEELDFEINRNFVSSDNDLDDEVNAKKLDLKKYASRGRKVLGELVSQFGEPSSTNLTKEQQEELNFAKSIKDQMKTGQKQQEDYDKGIKSAANDLSEIGLNLSDDLSINFKVSDEGKKELPEFISTMPHWRNEDGSWNHKSVAEDGVKIKYFDQIIKLAYEQGLNSGKDQLIKEAKNTTLDTRNTSESVVGGASKGIEIEGLQDYLGNKGVKLRFGKK